MTDSKRISLSLDVEGVTTESSAAAWLADQSSEIKKVTRVENGKLWQRPLVEPGAFVDETAVLMGGIIVRKGCYVGPYAVVRLDEKEVPDPLIIDENSNLQDGSVVHSNTTRIGKNVIVAHQAIVHGAVIEDDVTIYIQAAVDGGGTRVGEGSFLHRGAYVGKAIIIPKNSYVEPGRTVLTQEDANHLPRVTGELLAIRDHVLELNRSHVQRYLGSTP